MPKFTPLLTLLLPLFLCTCGPAKNNADGNHETTKWALLTLPFNGPQTSEEATDNPFTNYRLTATLTHENGSILSLPGYFAADGDAAETSADAGNIWHVNVRAPEEGTWTYAAELRHGDGVATEGGGEVVQTYTGTIEVGPALDGEKGRLVRNHPRYLQWTETGEYFLKGATNSPENFLGYFEIDSTYRHVDTFRQGENFTVGLHQFADHVQDFKGGPTWQGGKGKGAMGALQYLHDQGANGFYTLTMNINGDGKDVWPFLSHTTLDRFDVSKLAQWERIFQHADDLGMMIHLVLQETENENLLDGGDTGPQRQLYFREMIARYGHHRALTWNLGEENGPNSWSDTHQTTAQQQAMIAYLAENDPWKNYVVLHTHPGEEAFAEIYRPLLGNEQLSGLSLQLGNPFESHEVTKKWLALSQEAGAPWIMTVDETGPWYQGLDHDTGYTLNNGASNNQDSLRAYTLWGNLMAGGAGVEWYFGAKNAQNDLNAETYRTRERAWNWTGHGIAFFQDHLPFWEMDSHDELVTGEAMCLAKPGEVYAVYAPKGETTSLSLSGVHQYRIDYYDPTAGGDLFKSGISIFGPVVQEEATLKLDGPSEFEGRDWAAVVRRISADK